MSSSYFIMTIYYVGSSFFRQFHYKQRHPKWNKKILGQLIIFLGSSIISTYRQKFENQCFILYHKFHIKVQFILFSISHIFIIIYFYNFYFNIIGRSEFQLLVFNYFIILRLQNRILYHLSNYIRFQIFSHRCYFQLSCHVEFVFLPAQWRRFTVTVVDCNFCYFYFFLHYQ